MQGLTFGSNRADMGTYQSARGHELRFLAAADSPESPPDYTFAATETAAEVLNRAGGKWVPDLFICWTPELFPPPREVENAPVKTAAVVSDWNVYHAQLADNLARYDVVLTDRLGERELDLREAEPRYFFPIYSQCSRLHRPMETERDIDVLFAGNLNHAVHAERGRLLETVAALSGQYRIVLTTGYTGEDYARLLNRARIVFNRSLRSEMNLRCFEALACGAVLFLEEDNLEARDYLEDGAEVVYYRPENLAEKLTNLLEDPAQLRRIGENGLEKAPELAMESRFDDLFDWLAAQPPDRRAFRDFAPVEKAYATVMQYGSGLAPSQTALSDELLLDALEKWPDHPGFLLAKTASLLEQVRAEPVEKRKPLMTNAIERLHEAARLAPEAAPIWMNMAFVCRVLGARDAERRFLEQAAKAPSCAHGGLVFGEVDSPYFHLWRRRRAAGRADIALLHAWATARLAHALLEAGAARQALELTRQSISLEPGISAPYLTAGLAHERLGDAPAAVETLAAGLERSAFDEELRMALVRSLHAAARPAEARTLAEASARIFRACEGRETTAGEFEKAGAWAGAED